MKSQDFQKLTTKTIAELKETVGGMEKELMDLHMQMFTKKVKNLREFKTKRHDLAKIKTVINLKSLEAKKS